MGQVCLPTPVWALCLLLALGCQSDPGAIEAPPPEHQFRLLAQLDHAEIIWPGELERPESLKRTWLGGQNAHTARMAYIDSKRVGDSRAVLLAPTGSSYRFDLRLPSDPVLRFAAGTLPGREEGRSANLIARVTPAGEESVVVLEESLESGGAAGWLDREVDLAAWAGREIALELISEDNAGSSVVWAGWAAPEIVSQTASPKRWDVILISLDTLRADHLGCYGYERPTTPNLDKLAADGIRFDTALSQSPWTRSSHRALFSGLYPITRGGLKSPPIAQVFWEAGYRTTALTGGGQMDFRFGFGRGFDVYRNYDWIRDIDSVLAPWVQNEGRSIFQLLHTYEIHDPYIHPELAAGEREGHIEGYFDRRMWESIKRSLTEDEKSRIRDLYDGDVAFTDRMLGDLFEALASRKILERAIVVVTSDHGEQFWEHGSWRHGQNLYDHQLRVPLIFHLPAKLSERLEVPPGFVVDQPARLIDLYPTLLELVGIQLGHEIQGLSLLPLLRGRERTGREAEAFAESTNVKHSESKSLQAGPWKLILSFERGGIHAESVATRTELYNLESDPQEQRSIAAEQPEIAAALEVRLREILAAGGAESTDDEDPVEIDPDLAERLRALGYID